MIESEWSELIRVFVFFVAGLLVAMGTLVWKARRVDPLPLLPLAVSVCALYVGIRLAMMWGILRYTFPDKDPLSVQSFYGEAFGSGVFRAVAIVTGGLWVHCLVYAFAELRRSKKRGRLTLPTRVVFHGVLFAQMMALLMFGNLGRALYQRPLEELREFRMQEPISVRDAKEPGRIVFQMWFADGIYMDPR